MDTIQINGSNGLRNDISSERFEAGDLLVARNVEIDETGKVARRRGVSRLSAGAASSLWSDGERAFYVRGGTLYQLQPDLSSVALTDGVGTDVAYAAVADTVFWSDGKRSGRVADGVCERWGIEPPRRGLVVTPTVGDLPAGIYGVTLVYLRRGMESGAPRGVFVELAAHQGLRLTDLPVSDDPAVSHKRIYLTRPDGEVFFAAATIPNADTSAVITALPADTLPLRTQFKGAAPAGQLVGYYAGRTYVADGATLWYSEPYEYELFDRRSAFLPFPSPITLFAPVSDGVFVATEQETVFLAGREPSAFDSTSVLPYGAVRGTLVYPRNELLLKGDLPAKTPMWMSRNGVCIGLAGGQVLNLTGGRFGQPEARYGGGLFKVRGGTPHYVATLFS